MSQKKSEVYESDWAYSEKLRKNIHISKAESGLKGYRCIGCHSQMQAVIQKKDPSRMSFFRHHATNVTKTKPECIRANKEYREKIARAILNRLKYVNAPAIYKNPPNHDENLLPMKIDGKRRIEASYTKAELTFYEDENGLIRWGRNPEVEEKDLLIRPDVTFFNKENKPILFVEFIVTNKISQDKYLKLSRIGIDTLQINIPRKSEEDIERALKSSRTYKWVYNEREATTEYIPISRRDTEEFSQIDDNERIIFEEDFRCRQSEINQLIRSIEKCLSSKQYREIEYRLNEQIQKVERNSKRARERLEQLEESNRKKALGRNSEEEREEDKEYRNLETRYLNKRKELERDTDRAIGDKEYRDRVKADIERTKQKIREIEQELSILETETTEKIQSDFNESIEREEREIENLEKKIRDSIDRELDFTDSNIKSLGILYDDIPRRAEEDFKYSKKLERARINRIREERDRIEGEIHQEFAGEISAVESKIRRIEREERNFEETATREFNAEIKTNTRRLPKDTRNLLEAQRMGDDFKIAQFEEDSYRRAKKFFKKGTWKTQKNT